MKRYLLKQDDTNDEPMMEESDDGEWVRFDDVEKEVAVVEAWILEVIEQTKREAKEVECNCAIMLEAHQGRWICPAHGYKKI